MFAANQTGILVLQVLLKKHYRFKLKIEDCDSFDRIIPPTV
jgi:hypothetical protein